VLVVNFCTALSQADLGVRVKACDRDGVELMHVPFDRTSRTMTPYILRASDVGGEGDRDEPSAAILMFEESNGRCKF